MMWGHLNFLAVQAPTLKTVAFASCPPQHIVQHSSSSHKLTHTHTDLRLVHASVRNRRLTSNEFGMISTS
eukprot:2175379-Amphidinium_carterae.1